MTEYRKNGLVILLVAGAVLGAVFGSFIAVIAIRWPAGRSAMKGRSVCDGCGAPIAAARVVPVASYLLQRGRAACCGARIDPLHLVAEIAGALIGLSSLLLAPDLYDAIAGAIFGWLLLSLALLDARHFWLPDKLTATLALTGLAAGLLDIAPSVEDRLIGGVAGYAVFALVRFGYRRLRGREGMGGGDVKLFGAIGLWLGWQTLPLLLFGAAAAGLLWSAIGLVRGKRLTATARLPFGVFLAVSAWACWIFGEARYSLPM